MSVLSLVRGPVVRAAGLFQKVAAHPGLRRLQAPGLLFLFCLLAFLYFRSRTLDFAEHERVLQALHGLKQDDSLLARNLLRSRFGLDRTYDPLNETMFRIETHLNVLRRNKQVLDRNQTLKEAFVRYDAGQAERKVLLDSFKADNAVLRNSLYYLPISTRRVEAVWGYAPFLNDLLREVLLYNLSGDSDRIARINRNLGALGSEQGVGDAAVLARHIGNVLRKKQSVDQQIVRIDGFRGADLVNRMFEAYEVWSAKELHRSSIYRLLMFAVATGLILYVVFVILKLYLARFSLAEANQSLVLMNQAAQRFVPVRFLEFLGRRDLMEVRLGDCRHSHLTVLFSDIRSFTSLSEGMTPEENFAFINSYLSRMGPIISAHNGFIDKYIGDAIMALFDGGPGNAVVASLEMLRSLERYNNEHRRGSDREPIRIGIGIHVGDMMLGTIGETGRMEGTVISDAVNLAARIENLTKHYQVPLLISQAVVDELPVGHGHRLRFIDEVAVKGKQIVVRLHEVYDLDPPELAAAKAQAAPLVEEGCRLISLQEQGEAARVFRRALALLPGDVALSSHLERAWRSG